MRRVSSACVSTRRSAYHSYTLIELLTVIALIVILVGIILAAAIGVMTKTARARASGEIAAMGSALDMYKTDNGAYPPGYPGTNSSAATSTSTSGSNTNQTQASYSSVLLPTNNGCYALDPSAAGGAYQQASQALYEALSGKTNYADTPVNKTYMQFRVSELGNYTTTAGTTYAASTATYVQDPWSYAYGYSIGGSTITTTFTNSQGAQTTPTTGTNAYTPLAGASQYDLWSTAGLTANPATTTYATNTWISNWRY